jgi:hypothetical protein
MSKIILLTVIVTLLGFQAEASNNVVVYKSDKVTPARVIQELKNPPIRIVNYKYPQSRRSKSKLDLDFYEYIKNSRITPYKTNLHYKEGEKPDEEYIRDYIEIQQKTRGVNMIIRGDVYKDGDPKSVTETILVFFLIN